MAVLVSGAPTFPLKGHPVSEHGQTTLQLVFVDLQTIEDVIQHFEFHSGVHLKTRCLFLVVLHKFVRILCVMYDRR